MLLNTAFAVRYAYALGWRPAYHRPHLNDWVSQQEANLLHSGCIASPKTIGLCLFGHHINSTQQAPFMSTAMEIKFIKTFLLRRHLQIQYV
jgi:hypothetical protein